MSAAPQTEARSLIGDAKITFKTTSSTAAAVGLRSAELRAFDEHGPGICQLSYVMGREDVMANEVVHISTGKAAIWGTAISEGIQVPLRRSAILIIIEDLRMAMRKERARLPEAVRVLNEMWSMASAPEAPAEPEEPREPLELIAVVEAPTEYGPYMVNKLTLDGEDLEELLIEHGGRELSITRNDDGYDCEWSDDWSPAPKVVAISLLLNLGEHTPDDVVAIACDAAAGMIEGDGAGDLDEDDDGDDIVAEVIAELRAETDAAQASIIDAPNEAAPVRNIPTAWLTLDERCQPRTGIDEATVQRYIEALREGVTLPPIEVVASRAEQPIWVVDGWHRTIAHRRVGSSTIQAVRHVGELRDAIWRALSANATNGLQRTQADLARAIGIALDDPEWAAMSDRALAKHVGCSDKTIARHKRLRQEAAEREQEDQEALPKKPSPPQEALDPSAEIRTPETTRHETIERITTTSNPERCEHTLDLVDAVAPSTQAEAPESRIMGDEDLRLVRNDRELERLARLISIGWDLTISTPRTVGDRDQIDITLTRSRQR